MPATERCPKCGNKMRRFTNDKPRTKTRFRLKSATLVRAVERKLTCGHWKTVEQRQIGRIQ